MEPASIIIAQFLAEFIAGKFLEDNILAKFKESQIKREIADVIDRTLRDTISDFPDAEYIFNNLEINSYLSDPFVQSEIGKLVQSNDATQPIGDVLKDKWLQYLSSPISGNFQIVVDNFLVRLKRNLWEIKELQELLHLKQQNEVYELIKNYLPSLQHSISEISSNLPSTVEVQDESERAIVQKMEVCRSLLRQGFPTASLAQLRTLESDIQNLPISNQTRSKFYTLLGGSNLDIGNFETSIECFSRAYQLSPKDPDTIANMAVVNLFNGKFDDAIKFADEAISLKPSGTNAHAVRFESLARKRKFENVDELVEEKQLDDLNYVRTVGIVLSSLPESSKAERYLRLGIAQSPDDFYVGMALCKVITDKVAYFHMHPTVWMNKTEINKMLGEAFELTDAIVVKTQKGDNRYKLLQVLASRAGINAIMGKFDLAKADCDTVLAEDPKHPLALQNRALLALGEKDFQKAVSLFSSLPDDVLFDETISIGFIRSCLGGNKPDLAISFIGRAKEHNPLSDYIFLEAWAHIQNGDLTSALKLREAVLSRPENFKSYEIAGYIDQQLNNYEEALSNFETAYNLCPDENQKCFLALQLAQIYYNAHRYTESVDWFDKSKMDLSIDLVLAKLYVGALYWAKNYEKAILFARSVRESGVLDKNLLQIESSISEFLGNLTEALDLTRETILIDPGDLHHKMNCARLLFRLNKIEEALSILNNINVDGLTPIELMMTAEMYSFVGSAEKAILMGYLAYSRGKDSADLHMAYLGLFLRLEKSLVLDSLTIEADTAILLEADNEQRWIKILSTIKPNEANWEYATESQQAKLLLGHRVGDLIPYKDSPLEKILYTVKEIQSVYVRAFQEIFLEFGPRFPDDSSLQKIQFKDDDVTPFLSSVAKMGVFSDQVFDLYKTGVLSSEQFARFSGRSKIPTMRALQITKDISVFASQGTHQEQWEQNKLASESIDLTVSISALLTLQLLGIQDNFVRRFKNIYIHQRLLDEIDHALLDARHERVSGKSTVGYHNGQFFWNETSEVFLVDEIENLEALQRLIKDHCQVVALKPEFADALLNIQDIAANPVGELSLVSIMMAKQMQTPLYSDDLVVSLYAKSKYDVSAFWTQPLLIEMLSKDQIDFSAYCNLCCRLLEAGYVYTSTNDQMILQIIQEDKFTSSGRLNVVLLGLRQPTIEGFAIEIAVKVIRSIWMGFATSEQRRFILDKILYNLTIGRRLDRVLIQVMRKVNREFSLAPIQLPDIQNEIRLWHNVHASPNKNRLWFP